MSVIDSFTDSIGLSDSKKALRQAEENARRQLEAAERARIQSNELAQQAQFSQQQMAERARLQEQIAAQQVTKPDEAEVDLTVSGENAVRKRARFQAPTDPMASIRI